MINEWVTSLKNGLVFLESRRLFFIIGFIINFGVCLIEFKTDLKIVTVFLLSIMFWFLLLNVIVYVYKTAETQQLKEEGEKLKANLQNVKEEYQKLLQHYNVCKEYLEKQRKMTEEESSERNKQVEIKNIDDVINNL